MKTILFGALACAACYGQSVVIVNSGSTNTAGFQIVVEPSGKAEYTAQPRRTVIRPGQPPKTVDKTIPKALAKSLFDDVAAAHPLSALPVGHCAKSVSFGTRLTVQFGSEASPDLSCGEGGNEKMRALIRDVEAVVKELTSGEGQ